MPADQILTVAQMRAAEQALIDAGSSVEALMDVAGRGAAEWVWRLAGRHSATVLCGPGNNGGDGYVLAETLRQRGVPVTVVAAAEPRTEAAFAAASNYAGDVVTSGEGVTGEVFVDCLFGSGLTRPLTPEHLDLLTQLSRSHRRGVTVDLPSGVESDSGRPMNDGLPDYDLTIALGAWKFAHYLMPASATVGALRLVEIGVAAVPGAAGVLQAPALRAPAADAHKYRRGLLAIVAGKMPGAALLASAAAQRAGAGYVKVFGRLGNANWPSDLVVDTKPLSQALDDGRIAALLVGPGLGRDDSARERLAAVLAADRPTVADADALLALTPALIENRTGPLIVTPHEGELAALERTFGLAVAGTKPERALALARAGNMVVVAKGPDTVIAAPDGRLACSPRAASWLSVAGTGDVLAGTIASRLATGAEPLAAAAEGVWLQAAAARLLGGPFTASELALAVSDAYAAAL